MRAPIRGILVALVLGGCGTSDDSGADAGSTGNDAGADARAHESGAGDDAAASDDGGAPRDDGGGNDASTGNDGGGVEAGSHWIPAKDTTFFWDLQNAPPDNTKNVGAYDIDGFGNS